MRMRSPAFSCLWRCDSSSLSPSGFTPGLSTEFSVCHTSQLPTGTLPYNRDKCYRMRPSGIPLAWQLWPLVGSCTLLAPETIAHSYLQEPAHKLNLKLLFQLFQVSGATAIHTYHHFLLVYLWYTGSSLGQARLEQLRRMCLPD